MDGRSGRCLCGSVTYAYDGAPNWQGHCHCESCRRNCAAPFTSYFGISHGKWRWTAEVPAVYASSPGVRRHFCARCGTPMAYEGDRWSHELHFYAATLDDPALFRPTAHSNWNEHLPWVVLADGLKCLRTPRRLAPGDATGVETVHALIRACFAEMDGRIDPPSSANRLGRDDLAAAAASGEVWVMDDLGHPVATVTLMPRDGHLEVGKLATAPGFRRQGLARQLLSHARARARALGLPEVRLQSRVELAEAHAAFRAAGFVETARTAHPGYDRPTSITFAREA